MAKEGKNYNFFNSDASFILMQASQNLTENDFANAEDFSGVRPKYIKNLNNIFLRWVLGPQNVIDKINKYVSYLERK